MGKVILTILDGVGISEERHGNAFLQANTPNIDYLWNNYPHSLLEASGSEVGLPKGQMGNSEVGHLNIGAGRIVHQPLTIVSEAINNGEFYKKSELIEVLNHVKENNSKLHIMGLLSNGGVHSYLGTFFAALKMAKENNIEKLYFHIITDGRDTLPDIANTFIKELEDKIYEVGLGKIATISGRYYAMDRDNNWERINKSYQAIVEGIGRQYTSSKELIEDNYSKKIFDEFIEPGVLDKNGNVSDNDGLIWINFRPDRAWEVLSSLTNKEFKRDFSRIVRNNLKTVTMMKVANTVIAKHIFMIDNLKGTLGEYISNLGLKQLRIAETEKYAHVTYFFDGGKEKILPGCDRILINSPKVATYDLKPEMSAYEITNKLLELINNYDLVILNYANGDMVGHTGNLEATIKAVQAIDDNIGKLYKKSQELNYTMIIIADHGNCEEMLDENNNILTSHTTNKVPCIITNKAYNVQDGKLGDIAPTILKIMNIDIPKEMTGKILI